MNLDAITTEGRNPQSATIDRCTTREIVEIINNEDKKIAYAIEKELGAIATAVDAIAAALADGGRLIYMGSGTSGRLGVLDASECPPTYSTKPEQVVGIISGGPGAMFKAVEGAEDNPELGAQDLEALKVCSKDIVVGIAASGRTPYVLGGLAYAKAQGVTTVSISCSETSAVAEASDIAIKPIVGPEVVSGSTRMKAGTAQKLVLNMLSTGAMIKLGKVYGNLMVDVKPSNAKLIVRQRRIVAQATACSTERAEELLALAGGETKTAILMELLGLDATAARERLASTQGHIGKALQ